MSINDYFGERSILFNDNRSATVVADGPVVCWALPNSAFKQILDADIQRYLMQRISLQDDSVALTDLRILKTLGAGTFGTVFLAASPHEDEYALKAVSKSKAEKYKIHANLVAER
jgi:CRP-like cAMP-binding protein